MKILSSFLAAWCFCSLIAGPAAAISSQDLRNLIQKDARLPQADQYFSIGPMRDGRTIRAKMSFASDFNGIRVDAVSNGQFIIRSAARLS